MFQVGEVRFPNKGRVVPFSNILASWWERAHAALERWRNHKNRGNGKIQQGELPLARRDLLAEAPDRAGAGIRVGAGAP